MECTRTSHCFRLGTSLGLIGSILLAGSVWAATGNEAIAPSQPEYTLGDTAVIYGQGFAPNSSIVVEVIRADNTIVTGDGTETPGSDTVTANASGAFTYYYLLDGGPPSAYNGTLTVNARDASTLAILATTTFLDSTNFLLQGCSRARGECTLDNPATGWADGASPMTGWTSGNLQGWFELEDVPYRLRIGLRDSGSAGTYYIMNEHDNLRSGVTGIDSASNFYVGAGPSATGYTEGQLTKTCTFQAVRFVGDIPTTSNPCIVTGPTYTEVNDDGDGATDEETVDGVDNDGDGKIDEDPARHSGGASVRQIQYVWAVLFNSSEAGGSGKKWALYWTGHLAAGSHNFPGSSLHTHTTATGSQDVPISDVEEAGPSGADLAITKTDSPDPVLVGQNLTYTITVTNNGPSTATAVTVTDTLPVGVTFVSATASVGSCTLSGGTITCGLGDLANGASATVTIVVTPAMEGTLSNTGIVSSTTSDPSPGNNTAGPVTTTVSPSADLSITKSDSPDPVLVGQTLTYTLVVTNNGPSSASGVVVTDTLPGGVTFGTASWTGASTGTCTNGSGTVTCTIGTLASGASVTITITVTPTAPGTLTNSASVSSSTNDPNSGNNSTGPVTTTVNPSADLSIAKTDSPDPVVVNDPLTYTITVTNNGPSSASGVTVTDTLPPGVTFVSVTPGSPTCTQASGTVTCNLGTLANGASTSVTIVVTVNATGVIANTATVSSGVFDPYTPNNSATAQTNGDQSRLINISTRLPVQTGDYVLIGGFIVGGDAPKTLLVRGRGPSMSGPPFNIPGTLANPYLQLYSGSTLIAQNDNWQATDPLCLSPATGCGTAAQITATGMDPCQPNPGQTGAPPGCTQEAAILITLPPGPYTAILSGVGGGTGVGLVEVFDPDTSTLPKLVNISSRGFVLTGDNVMIGGFIIGAGTGNKKVVIRARGPSMSGAPFNIPGTLPNPTICLYSGPNPIACNDDWQVPECPIGTVCIPGGVAIEAIPPGYEPCQPNPGQTVPPPNCDLESALSVTLPPGPYTAIVQGVGGSTGVGLVEIFELAQ